MLVPSATNGAINYEVTQGEQLTSEPTTGECEVVYLCPRCSAALRAAGCLLSSDLCLAPLIIALRLFVFACSCNVVSNCTYTLGKYVCAVNVT